MILEKEHCGDNGAGHQRGIDDDEDREEEEEGDEYNDLGSDNDDDEDATCKDDESHVVI